jgi:integrase
MREEDELTWHLYERTMKQRALSQETIDGARRCLASLAAALPDGTDLLGATEADVEAWLAALRDNPAYSQATHATYYRRAHAFYAWAAKREYTEASPMARLDRVQEQLRVIPLPDPADMTAVLAACAGKGWRDRRDLAMLRILLEAGTPRASEVARLELAAVDRRRDTITVLGKGGLERTIPFGERTGHALTLPQLFFTPRGATDRNGVYKIITARCRAAGVPPIPPHHWRHWSAHEWQLAGGSESDAMKLFGWRSPAMAARYGAAAAASRAIEHARQHAQGDRL